MPGKGKRVNSTAKTIIFNVYSYFERQSQKSKGRGPPKLTSRTVDATGYSERAVRRIVAGKNHLKKLHLDHLQSGIKWRGRRSLSMTLTWKVYGSTFIVRKSTLHWNPCLLWLKRKVCLMVSELLSGSCSVSLVSGISKLMISGMCMSSPV